MSNQFAIQAGPSSLGAVDTTTPPRGNASGAPQAAVRAPPAAPPAEAAQGTATKPSVAASSGPQRPSQPVALFANPSYRFDPTTGLVVIEFHDDKGTISNTIPSQRQLQAYRTHQASLPGAPTNPPGNGKTSPG